MMPLTLRGLALCPLIFGVAAALAAENDVPDKLRRDAEQGDASAQYNLGLTYDNGIGVPQDHAEAAEWTRRAAEQGHAMAQYNLGLTYAKGEGLPQDFAEAVQWYRRAAKQGLAGAQANLGVMYAKGEGLPQDYVAAHLFLNLAGAKGNEKVNEDAGKARNRLAAKMTAVQVAEAQRRAREWKEKPRHDGQ